MLLFTVLGRSRWVVISGLKSAIYVWAKFFFDAYLATQKVKGLVKDRLNRASDDINNRFKTDK